MRYGSVVEGIFLQRVNRFVAWVQVNGTGVRCHVKNTGRLKELFVSGARCVLAVADNPNRATAYDLVGIWRGDVLVNVDSQAPNAAAREWVSAGGLGDGVTLVKPEFPWGNSRFDLYAERRPAGRLGQFGVGEEEVRRSDTSGAGGEEATDAAASVGAKADRRSNVSTAGKEGDAKFPNAPVAVREDEAKRSNASAETFPVERLLIEVKGVTLNVDGEARFPDAPTERGVKHVRELIEARRQGYRACVVFVIQMPDVSAFAPNDATHPAFGDALRDAARAGVEIHAVLCQNTPDSMVMTNEVPVRLEASDR
ncbi:MAG: DNA/RNA nuclease SfsA [Clostridia bacterium]|nr:DNA/RNA nuclease SfsA [Clostridia bacterium]